MLNRTARDGILLFPVREPCQTHAPHLLTGTGVSFLVPLLVPRERVAPYLVVAMEKTDTKPQPCPNVTDPEQGGILPSDMQKPESIVTCRRNDWMAYLVHGLRDEWDIYGWQRAMGSMSRRK